MPKAVLFIWGLLIIKGLGAQPLPLVNYTPANGLVDARVTKMFQDSWGRLYFLTQEGFSIFDGQHFDNYGAETKYGTGIISDVAEYENGLVRVYGFDGDIYTVNRTQVSIDTSQRGQLREISKIFSIGKTDKLIITNYTFLREIHHRFIPFRIPQVNPLFIENSLLLDPYLILVQIDGNKKQQIFLYNYVTRQTADSLEINSPVNFLNKNNRRVLLTTAQGNWYTLDSLSLQKGKIKLQPFATTGLLPENFRYSRIQTVDAGDGLWLVNPEKGYCQVNLSEGGKTFYSVADGILNPANWVFEDGEKNIWFGSTARGVQELQRTSLEKLDKIAGVPLGYVNTIHTSPDRERFINAVGGVFLGNKKVSSSAKDNNGFIFWEGEYWNFKDYKTLVGSQGHVYDLAKLIPGYSHEDFLFAHSTVDPEGRLVIAGRVFIFIDRDYQFHYFRPPYFCDNIIPAPGNEYWCFLRSNVIIRLKWEKEILQIVYSKAFPDLAPRYTIQWDEHTFLAGTRLNGIKIFRLAGNDLQQTATLNKANGLSNNFINVLLKKDAQHLMAGTGTGLDEITFFPHDTVIENISQRSNIYVPFTDLVQLQDSTVLARTLDGQLFEVPNSLKTPSGFSPAFFFTSIRVNGDIIAANEGENFRYHQNNWLFRVSAPTFFDNKRILFNFTLAGNGQQWVQSSNAAEMEIKNLNPGSYSLKVTVQYPGKIYPNQELTYRFTLTPPYWKRWWFMALLALGGLLLISYLAQRLVRQRLRQQAIAMEKQQAIEKERTRIATDMHDDFGANLSRIKFISEKMQVLNAENEHLKTDLVKISAYSDEMADKMNEIVWALNQRYDSLEDLISFSRAYAADYLQDKNIALKFQAAISGNKILNGEVRRNIFMVIKEALHNVIKHSGAKNVSIRFEELADQLQVYIMDDGRGIDLDNIRPFANGLENMKKRMETVGGTLQVSKEKGTIIALRLPM